MGGNARGGDDGSLNATTLGAVWDVAYNPLTGEMHVSEPLTGHVRSVSGLAAVWGECARGETKPLPGTGECTQCPSGHYCPGGDAAYSCALNQTSAIGSWN
eukprot:2354662-Rhodomonas_salina.1